MMMKPLSPTIAYLDPELVLVLSWMAARDEHIAKYIARHRALFPAARILLIRCPLSRVWLPWAARRDMRPALPLLRALAEPGPGSESESESASESDRKDGAADKGTAPRVLVHVFSNGGITTAARLAKLLRGPGRGTDALPRYVAVLNSCPGYFRWRNTHQALVQTLPRWASPLMHLAIAVACVYQWLRRHLAAQNAHAQAARAPALARREARRVYLYGTADDMVDCADVEDHARRTAEAGFAVRRERFDGGRHVALARADPERY